MTARRFAAAEQMPLLPAARLGVLHLHACCFSWGDPSLSAPALLPVCRPPGVWEGRDVKESRPLSLVSGCSLGLNYNTQFCFGRSWAVFTCLPVSSSPAGAFWRAAVPCCWDLQPQQKSEPAASETCHCLNSAGAFAGQHFVMFPS